jgi:glycerophosphoryl diester phosphodiesterase
VETGLIIARTPPVAEILARTKSAAATWALCGITDLTADAVTTLHTHNLRVTAWPVPDPSAYAQAVALGVDGITTDHPGNLPLPRR